MRIKVLVCIIFFLLYFIMPAEGGNYITLLYPPDKTATDLDFQSISVTVQESVDLIKVIHDDNEETIVPKKDVECFSVRLTYGMNKVNITALVKGTVADKVSLRVFRRSDLIAAYKNTPAGFNEYIFHTKEQTPCTRCHNLQPTESDKIPVTIGSFPSATAEGEAMTVNVSTCNPCHKKLVSYTYVHGPASVWNCLICHDPQAGIRYSVKKTEAVLCFDCHSEEKHNWTSKKFMHGPVSAGKCIICHSPHASENPYNLLRPAWSLCTSCHTDDSISSGRHVITSLVSDSGHPTHGKPDPLRKDRELSCASCHNPHASNVKFLFMTGVDTESDLCVKCHIGH